MINFSTQEENVTIYDNLINLIFNNIKSTKRHKVVLQKIAIYSLKLNNFVYFILIKS